MTHLPDRSREAPRVRQAIADLPAYVAGKPPKPRDGAPTYKLSSNENPHPPLHGVKEAVAVALDRMNRYPDMGCTDLYAALSRRLGVPADHLAVGTGSVAVLYYLLQAFCEAGDEVVYAWRSFEAYPIAVAVTGATAVPVPLTEGARHDLHAMLEAITEQTKVVVLCTPNNPTGPALTHAEVEAFVDRVPPHIVVAVDEAYREFVRSEDPVDGLRLYDGRPNVVVMRTFAKAYGLAGLRVGYLVAPAGIAAAARACALPFGVSSVAQAAAVASLEAEDELMARVEAVVAERERVVAELRLQGWSIPDAQGNFVWLGLGDRAAEFTAAAEEDGIMVRPFTGEGVRVTVGEPEANDIFLALAAKWAEAG